jgi:type II secretory pathway pseudopilin PulG
VKVRVQEEAGFGLIELLMAIVMLNIGILALVAAFNSGAIALKRASHVSNASVLADSQMELYRGLTYAQIALDSTQISGNTDTTYKCDSALGTGACPYTITTCSASCADGTVPVVTCAGSPLPKQCQTSRTSSGMDSARYRVDTYIRYITPAGGRQTKQVTIVVRDADNLAKQWARETSTFDPSVSG